MKKGLILGVLVGLMFIGLVGFVMGLTPCEEYLRTKVSDWSSSSCSAL